MPPMQPAEHIVVLCTCPDEAVAGDIARHLVSQQFAACVNLLPGLRSVYRWEGELQDDTEVQLVIKTTAEKFERLRLAIVDNHPYDTPEVIALPIVDGHEPYLDWIGQSCR